MSRKATQLRSKQNQYSKEIYAIFATLGVFGSQTKEHMEKNPEKNPLNGIDGDTEYAKIQAKTSTLPRHKRDLVVFLHDN